MIFQLASGEVLGYDQPIALKLLGSERSLQALEGMNLNFEAPSCCNYLSSTNHNILGVAMELEDSLFPLLREVSIGIDPYEVFQDADWALLIGAKPRGPGMERAALLDINGQIFVEQVSLLILRLLHIRVLCVCTYVTDFSCGHKATYLRFIEQNEPSPLVSFFG